MDETLERPGAGLSVGEVCRTVPPFRQTGHLGSKPYVP